MFVGTTVEFKSIISYKPHPVCEADIMTTPFLQMRKLRHRELSGMPSSQSVVESRLELG